MGGLTPNSLPLSALPFLMLEYRGNISDHVQVIDGVPGLGVGLAATSIACFGLVVLLLTSGRGLRSAASEERFGFALCAINLFGMFTLECDYIDEVYTNLEHPWNLFHHGRFSVQPNVTASGTADILYYGLLTPFAKSHLSLTAANFTFGFLLALVAITSLWSLAHELRPSNRLLLVFACTLSVPFLRVMSDGLGTPIIGTGFLLALACFERRPESQLGPLVAAALPLWRPDALPVAGVLLLYVALTRKRVPVAAVLLSGVAFGLYFLSSRIVYGVWVPTPLIFKSFRSSMLAMLDKSDWMSWTDFFARPDRILPLAFAPLALVVARRGRMPAFAVATAPLLALLVVMYAINTNPMYDTRYAIGLEVALFAAMVFVAVEVQHKWPARDPIRAVAGGLVIVLVWFAQTIPLSARRTEFIRASDLGYGGQELNALMPQRWRLAVTEMNTIGFMIERPIVDLWGYTNLRIATSAVCSGRRVRTDERLFLDEQPEVFLFRTGNVAHPQGGRLLHSFSDPTNLVTSDNMSPSYNQLGDMREVLRRYQPIGLQDGQYVSLVFVRADKVDEFLRHAKQRHYQQTATTPLDDARIRKLYKPGAIRRYDCG